MSQLNYNTPVARLLVRQAHAQTKCVSTPYFVGGDNLAYLIFVCLFAKNKWAKLCGIAKAAFSAALFY
jgi:hypothetical protein